MEKRSLFILLLLKTFLAFGQAPLANFSATQTEGCVPFVVSFQDQSSGSPATWEWDLGNGRTSALQNPAATYLTAGTYTVSLTVTNSNGSNKLTRTAYITVYDKPKIDFAASSTTGCYPFAVQFGDKSVASAGTSNTSWFWDFGNGTQSTQASPQATYKAAGDYPVTLKVTSNKGCFASLTKPAYIHVPNGLNPGFSHSPVDRCRPPFPVTFSNSSSGPGTLSYWWDFGDGTTSTQTNPSHTYASGGNYTVTMVTISDNGCRDTLTKKDAIVIQNITTSFSTTDSICTLSPISFQNTSAPAPQSSRWVFGDGTSATGTNQTKAFSTAGTYTVRLYNTYAYCTDSATKDLHILPRPKAAFAADETSKCQPPLTVRFTDASSNAVSWKWLFGDGQTSQQQNPTHTYTNYGDYTVTLMVTNVFGCTDTLTQTALIKIRRPVISFPGFPQTGCTPYSTSFSASVQTLDAVTSYLWDFGDGNTSTATAPPHTYPNQGSYPVKLTITTSTGCTESYTMPNAILVGRKPVIDFTATPNPVCAYQTVLFNGITTEGDQWAWDLGDGATATVQNPTHTYTDTGTISITMAVTNSGCRESLTKNDFVIVKPPIARFVFAKDCNNTKRIAFTDQSVNAKTWLWDFGDGTTATGQSPSHVYANYGSYTVTLTVTNGDCSHSFSNPVQVFQQQATLKASTNEACKTAAIQFSAVSTTNFVTAYNWQFSNGATSSAASPQITFATAGNFDATLVTTDIYGCRDTTFQPAFVRINGPSAGFGATNNIGCKGLNVTFNDTSSTDAVHAITNRKWFYGDGQTQSFSNTTNLQHTYPTNGNYNVKLIITDAAGCTDSLQVDNLVRTSSPKAAFAANDTLLCLGSQVSFTNQSNAQNFSSYWKLGDGSTATDKHPVHQYTDTGTYTIGLKVVDENGCADSLTLPNYLTIKKTTASFTVSDSIGGCTPYEVRFTNTSKFYTSVLWNFGSSTSNVVSPSTSFSLAGSYPVTLVVTGNGGCTDTAKKTITVYDDSTTKYSYTPINGCKPLLLTTSISSPAHMTYAWDFGDGSLITTKAKDTAYRYTTFGDFVPRLIVSDSGNCLLAFVGADTIRIKGVTTKFAFDKQLLCDSGLVRFTDSTLANEPVTAYRWSFGDGGVSAQTNPVHQYTQPGFYSVQLTAQTASGCTDTTAITNLVKVVQSPSISILGDTAGCSGTLLLQQGVFLRQDTAAVRWYWQFPNGVTTTGIRPPAQRYTRSGSFVVTATAVNSSGCVDTAFSPLQIYPLPQINLPATITTMVGTPVQLQPASYSSNVVQYSWTPATGLSCTDCPSPYASPKFNTLYRVAVTDSNGCRSLANVQVIVFCSGANVFVPNTFSPNGDGSNDVFYVRGSGLARVKSLRIFNRLGEVVFERQNVAVNDVAAGWDGTYKGAPLAPGTFVYQVDVFCDNNDTIRFDGSLTLIR